MPMYRVRGLQTLDCEWWIEADDAGAAEQAIDEGKLEPQNVVDVHECEIEEIRVIKASEAIRPYKAEMYV